MLSSSEHRQLLFYNLPALVIRSIKRMVDRLTGFGSFLTTRIVLVARVSDQSTDDGMKKQSSDLGGFRVGSTGM